MQHKRPDWNLGPKCTPGTYLGMKGFRARFSHQPAMMSHKRAVECEPHEKIETLQVIEPRRGFKGTVVKPKVKSVNVEVESCPCSCNKSALPTAEELRKLTRKLLKDFGLPRQSKSSHQARTSKPITRKPWNSTHQTKVKESSAVTINGRIELYNELCRVELVNQDVTTLKPRRQELSEGSLCMLQRVLPFRCDQNNPSREPRSSKPWRPARNRGRQDSQAVKTTVEAIRAVKPYLWSVAEGSVFLPSTCVSEIPLLLPRISVPMGRAALAGRWGNIETNSPGYKTPRFISALGDNLISKSVQLKHRAAANDHRKQVSIATPWNDTGSGRTAKSRSKASTSTKALGCSTSDADSSLPSEGADSQRGRQTAPSEQNAPGECFADVPVAVSEDIKGSLMPDFNSKGETEGGNEEEDGKTQVTDSIVRLAKQIEVIINLKDTSESADCIDGSDRQQINSD
eukprot:gi/632949986/ref/XP_007890474.1/ PREDICTED: uncharacterized protein LOC103177908 isoform X1 [Callorhinchus milii]